MLHILLLDVEAVAVVWFLLTKFYILIMLYSLSMVFSFSLSLSLSLCLCVCVCVCRGCRGVTIGGAAGAAAPGPVRCPKDIHA